MNQSARLLLIAFVATLWITPARAQSSAAEPFPSRPLRFIVPFSAGSATDQAARFIGLKLGEATGQQVIVENRPGANGIIGVQAAKAAAPNGYTVLLSALTTHAANPSLIKDLPYDPVRDFTPLTGLIRGALMLVVNSASPYESVGSLVNAARQSRAN